MAASPKEYTAPFEPKSQYPLPVGVGAIPMIGAARDTPPIEPRKTASPKQKIPPSPLTR